MIRSGGHINPVEKASSSHRYKFKVSGGNIIHLITGIVLGLVLSPFSQGNYRGIHSETSSYAPCYKINVNSGKAGLVAKLKKSTLPSNKRLLRAVYGNASDEFIRIIHELATLRPVLKQGAEELESSMMEFARQALHSIDSDINVDEAILSLDEPEPPTVVIKRATYGPKLGTNIADRGVASRADVKWILERLIFNSVLRIPKGVSVAPFFGTTPKGQINGQPYTLDIEGETANAGIVKVSIQAPEGILQSDLLISSAQPTQNIPINPDKLKDTLSLITKGKIGLDIGGPSSPIYQMDVYKGAVKTDVINFSEKTLWSTFQHGATFHYEGGGSGTAYITDGSTLKGISDSSYDFVIGSHYLEHLNNPLEALVAIRRVTKPGGHVILILPRKEACFDHLRGQSRIEDFIFRFLQKISATDMRYANLESWVYGNDLKRDIPAGSFYQLLARSIRYPDNRSIHTMVYDFKLLEALGKILSFEIILKGVTKELHQWIIFFRK
jgi:SAM-dependent methyltransferase